MSSGIGTKLYLDGEKEYKAALAEINRSMRVLGTEMSVVTAQFDKNDKSEQALTARSAALTKEVDAQKEKIEQLQNALRNAKEGFGENDKRTQSWQMQLNKAQAELIGMEKELGQTNKELDDVKNGAKNAGVDMEKFGDVCKKTAEAIGATFAAIGAGVLAAGKELTNLAKNTAEAGDIIDKQSQKVGLSAEAYQKWDYAMQISGTEMANCTTGLKTLTNTLDDARNGSEGAITKFERLGISIDDLKGKSREEVFEATVTALQNVQDETEKAALANDMFGKSGQDLMPLFNMTADATHALLEEAESYGMVMSNDAVAASATFQDSLTKLSGTIDGIKNKIGAQLLPGFTQIADGMADLAVGKDDAAETIGSGVSTVIDAISGMVPQVVEIVSTVSGAVLQSLPSVFESLAQGILGGITQLAPVLTDVITQLAATLVTLLPQIVEAGMQIAASLISGIAEAVPSLIPQITDVILQVAAVLLDNLPVLMDAALALLEGVVQGVLQSLPVILNAIPGIITAVCDALTNGIPMLWEAAIELLNGIVQALPYLINVLRVQIPTIVTTIVSGLTTMIPTLLNAAVSFWSAIAQAIPVIIRMLIPLIPSIVETIVQVLSDNFPLLLGAAIDVMMAIVQAIPVIVRTLAAEFPRIVETMLSALRAALPSLATMGRQLLEGLWNGIQNVKDWLIDKIRNLGYAVTDALKEVFGIASPSKVFEKEIGQNLGLGIGVGFEKAMDSVSRDMANAIPTEFGMGAAVSMPTQGYGDYTKYDAPIAVTLTLHIDAFNNYGTDDIDNLADELSVLIAEKINRRSKAF